MAGGINLGTIQAVLNLRNEISPVLETVTKDIENAEEQLESFAQHMTYAFGEAAQAIGAVFEENESRLKTMGYALGAGAVAAEGMAIGFGNMAIDINRDLANVSALLTDLSGDKLVQVTDSMRTASQTMGIEMGKSTREMTSGLYEIISSLGYTNDTFDQLQISAKAGAAGLAGVQESFNFLSAVTKTYGDTSAAAFDKVADLGFQAVNFGQTTFPALAASIGGVAPIAKVAGVSLEEMFAVIATATGVTGSTSEVVTQMASAINALLSPSAGLKTLYKELKVETGEAMIAQHGFVGALQQVAAFAERTKTPIIDLLGRKEAFIITASLAGSQAKTFATRLNDMGVAASTTTSILGDAFAKQTQGVNKAGFAWDQLRQKTRVAWEQLGQIALVIIGPIISAFNAFMGVLVSVTTFLGQWPKTVAAVAAAFLLLTKGIAGTLILLGAFSGAIGAIIIGLGGMLKTVAVWGLMKVGITMATAAITQYATAVVSSTATTTIWALATGKSVGFAAAAWSALTAPVRTVTSAIALLNSTMAAAVIAGWTAAALAAGVAGAALGAKLLEVGDKARGVDDHIRAGTRSVGTFTGAWALLKDAVSNGGEILSGIFQRMGAALSPYLTDAFEQLKAVSMGIELIWKGLGTTASWLGDQFFKLGSLIYGTADAQKAAMKDLPEWQARMKASADEAAKKRQILLDLAKGTGAATAAQGAANRMTDEEIKKILIAAKNTDLIEKAKKALGKTTLTLAEAQAFERIQKELGVTAEERAKKAASETNSTLEKQQSAMTAAVSAAAEYVAGLSSMEEGLLQGLDRHNMLTDAYKEAAVALKELQYETLEQEQATEMLQELWDKWLKTGPTLIEQAQELAATFGDLSMVLDEVSGFLDAIGAGDKLKGIVAGFSDLARAGEAGAMAFASFASGDIMGGIAGSFKALGSAAAGFKKLFFGGQEEHKRVNDMRDDFIEAAGGLDVLRLKAFEAGMGLEELLRADRVSEFEAAVERLNEAMSEHENWLNLQSESQDALNSAVEKYGFELSELPPKMKQAEMDNIAAGLLQDWKLLTAAGFDHGVMLERMGPAFSEYAQQAIASGVPLAESLRKPIEALIAEGKLLDENGKAYTSTAEAGITFAETQTEAFTRMADQIERLVNALLGIRPVPDPFASWTPPHIPGDGQYGPAPHEEIHAAGGFDGMVRGPTRFLAGEAGPEHVKITPAGGGASGISVSLGGISVSGASGMSAEAVADLVAEAVLNNKGNIAKALTDQGFQRD